MPFVPKKFNMYKKERYEELIDDIIQQSDVVLLLIDARLPEISRNKRIEQILKERGKEFIFVLNKFDLASKRVVAEEKKKLSKIAPVIAVSCKTGFGIDHLRKMIYHVFDRTEKPRRKVGLLGYPNMGKSSLINRLAKRGGAAKVSKEAGYTREIRWIRGKRMELVDGPGYVESGEKEEQLKLSIIGAKNPEQLHDPEMVAYNIIREMINKNKAGIEEAYDVKLLTEDPADAMALIGKRFGYLKSGGGVEMHKTSVRIIKDWQQGNLKTARWEHKK